MCFRVAEGEKKVLTVFIINAKILTINYSYPSGVVVIVRVLTWRAKAPRLVPKAP